MSDISCTKATVSTVLSIKLSLVIKAFISFISNPFRWLFIKKFRKIDNKEFSDKVLVTEARITHLYQWNYLVSCACLQVIINYIIKRNEKEEPKIYLKLLEMFILNTLFVKGEYLIHSKNFNPIKVFTILFLLLNFLFTIFLIKKINNIYNKISVVCPAILEEKPVIKKEIIKKKVEATKT